MNQTNSKRIFSEALKLMPGGVNSPARAFGGVGGTPIVMDRGEGCFLFDADGNRYIDYVLSWGPMILGHQHPKVNAALNAAVARGTSFGAPTLAENRLAELVISMVPSIEKIRLVNSGTEATMSAIRLARGYTGRDRIVKFIGNYHGHVDSLLVAAGSAAATLGAPNSPGITRGTTADTILVPYNRPELAEAVFHEFGPTIAGIIVEPVAGNMGCVPGTSEFLKTLRKLTKDYGSLLIFDEVMSGFRVAKGGAQEYYGIIPDLTTLGKIIGGGLPVGAYGGRAEIMDYVIPVGKVYQAGTLSGNPLATAAGIATLSVILEDPRSFYDQIEQKTTMLANGLEKAAKDFKIHASVQHIGGMITIFFLGNEDTRIDHWDAASRCNKDLFAKFFWKLIEKGVYFPCSQFETMFLSTAHTEEIIEETIEKVRESFAEITGRTGF
ncbi:MAG: glutamate-1-semialdehyde 2,1-aminomutase [Planctomycetia bacterium]|nr:glutamate-1-semialdehyde 2,1-aminomutase [Planctomycetia bacterium]